MTCTPVEILIHSVTKFLIFSVIQQTVTSQKLIVRLLPEPFMFVAGDNITINCTAEVDQGHEQFPIFRFGLNNSILILPSQFKHHNILLTRHFKGLSSTALSNSILAVNISVSLNKVPLTCLVDTVTTKKNMTRNIIILDRPPQPASSCWLYSISNDAVTVKWDTVEEHVLSFKVIITQGTDEEIYNNTLEYKNNKHNITIEVPGKTVRSNICKLHLYLINVVGESEPCIHSTMCADTSEGSQPPTSTEGVESQGLPLIWIILIVVVVGIVLITICILLSVAIAWTFRHSQNQKKQNCKTKPLNQNFYITEEFPTENINDMYSIKSLEQNGNVVYSQVINSKKSKSSIAAETYATVQDSVDNYQQDGHLSTPPLPPRQPEKLNETEIKDLPGYGEVCNASTTPKRVLSAKFSRTPDGSRNSQTPTSQHQVLPEYATVRDVVSRTHSLRTTPSVTSPSPLSPPPPQCSDLPVQDTVGYSTVADESKKIKRVRHGSHS